MIEFSRFGKEHDPTNAQFTVQPAGNPGDNPHNVHRITVPSTKEITLVMNWTAPPNLSVTFSEYNGLYNLDNLPSTPSVPSWTISATQNASQLQYVPNTGHQTIHLNLWRAWWISGLPKPGRSHRHELSVQAAIAASKAGGLMTANSNFFGPAIWSARISGMGLDHRTAIRRA